LGFVAGDVGCTIFADVEEELDEWDDVLDSAEYFQNESG
jgi:hypothetical protein